MACEKPGFINVDELMPKASIDDVCRPGGIWVLADSPYRSLAYNQAITSALGDYQLSGTPMADVNLSFNPLRFVTVWAR